MAVLRLFQAADRVAHDGDRALYDLAAGRDDGAGLLALEHRACDLRRVGEMGDPHVLHHHARHRDALAQFRDQVGMDGVAVGPERGDAGGLLREPALGVARLVADIFRLLVVVGPGRGDIA